MISDAGGTLIRKVIGLVRNSGSIPESSIETEAWKLWKVCEPWTVRARLPLEHAWDWDASRVMSKVRVKPETIAQSVPN